MMRRRVFVSLFLSATLCCTPAAAFANIDIDGDGIPGAEEDTDGDGVWDDGETNPLDADTDGGGEADGSEKAAGRDPLRHDDDYTFDRDGDGLTNGEEAVLGSNPDLRDTDSDGIPDHRDPLPTVAADGTDADRDGLPDTWEVQHGLSPRDATDASDDPDNDGISTLQEYAQGTDPHASELSPRTTLATGSGETLPPVATCLSYDAERLTNFEDAHDHWSQPYVSALARVLVQPTLAPVIQGYGNATSRNAFAPDRPISRFELLKIALYTNCLTPLPSALLPTSMFSDVPPASTEDGADLSLKRRIILTAAFLEIVEGYDDGTFRPDAAVTRAEAVKILINAGSLYSADVAPSSFADVPQDAWFREGVDLLFALGIVQGKADGLFHPEDPITRAEAAKITLLLLLGNTNVNSTVLPDDIRSMRTF